MDAQTLSWRIDQRAASIDDIPPASLAFADDDLPADVGEPVAGQVEFTPPDDDVVGGIDGYATRDGGAP